MEGRPEYREIEHTADVGFELEAPTVSAAFEAAALAMFDLMVDVTSVTSRRTDTIEVSGTTGDLENLMVRWLSELLFLHERDALAVHSVTVCDLDRNAIEAEIGGEPVDPSKHAVRGEIKAATYHDLAVREDGGRWFVRVIFDT
jgi:SHS2 domain-containing protein